MRPLFVPASKRSVPGGFAMLFNRIFEHGYWARLADVERAVYPALGYFARFSEEFEAEASISDLMEMTGLGRTSIKKAIGSLIERGLIAVEEQGSGRTKTRYRLLVPLKEAEEAHQADAAAERRRAKARVQDEPFRGSPSRPPAGRDGGPVEAAAATPAESRRRPAGGRLRAALGEDAPLVRKTRRKEEPLSEPDEQPDVVVDLCRLGVSPTVAGQLAEQFEADYLQAYADAFRRNRAEGRRYTAGWLVNAIREAWEVKHLRHSHPQSSTRATSTPETDPFEAAWRRAGELDDDAFESLRAEAVARCDDAASRRKLVQADRDAAHLRAAVAEVLMDTTAT